MPTQSTMTWLRRRFLRQGGHISSIDFFVISWSRQAGYFVDFFEFCRFLPRSSSPFTPNSAAAERVFSLLKAMFGDQQLGALADIIQTALMLRYNKRNVG